MLYHMDGQKYVLIEIWSSILQVWILPQVGGFSNGGDLCESNAENYNPNIENGVLAA